MAESYKKYLNKVFKFDGSDMVSNDSWMWVSWYMGKGPGGEHAFYCLYYTFDKTVIQQTASLELLDAANVAKINEVPNEFLYDIIKFELGE